jgi:hypothetical protein
MLMLAATPPPPSFLSAEQTIARIVGCGVPADAIRIDDEPELQEDVVRVRPIGAIADDRLLCVARASLASAYYVFFEDSIQAHYWSLYWELHTEASRIAARQWLAERGLLEKLPTYDPKGDLAAYARRLERICGIKRGTFLEARGGDLTIEPPKNRRDWPTNDAVICLSNAIETAGIPMGFIGREAEAPVSKP